MARVKKIVESKAGDWQTIFCSLSIILVAFFVMLCTYATPQAGKMIEIRRSFAGALKLFTGGVLFEKGEGIVVPSPDTSGVTPETFIAPIQHMLQGEGLTEQISLQSTREFISVSMLTSALFYSGTAEVARTALPAMRSIAALLSDVAVPVMVIGHTDDRPVADSRYASNLELSAARANAVVKMLITEGDIGAERVFSIGYGRYRPFVPNRTDEDRNRNNRVEIIIPLVADVFENAGGIMRKPPPSFQVWGVGD